MFIIYFLSSSTTSSTASIVSLAEGEAATSLVLQDDVMSRVISFPSLLFLLVFLLLPARRRVRASHVLPEVATSSPWSLLLSLPCCCVVGASYVLPEVAFFLLLVLLLLKVLVLLLILLLMSA